MSKEHFDAVRGLPLSLTFAFNNSTGLPVDMTNYVGAFEVVNQFGDGVLSKVPSVPEIGELMVSISGQELWQLQEDQHKFRLYLSSPSGDESLPFVGYITLNKVGFNPASLPPPDSYVVVDGVIYATPPYPVAFRSWFAAATTIRIEFQGTGVVSMDTMDSEGNIIGNAGSFFVEQGVSEVWEITENTAFAYRLNCLQGSVLARNVALPSYASQGVPYPNTGLTNGSLVAGQWYPSALLSPVSYRVISTTPL